MNGTSSSTSSSTSTTMRQSSSSPSSSSCNIRLFLLLIVILSFLSARWLLLWEASEVSPITELGNVPLQRIPSSVTIANFSSSSITNSTATTPTLQQTTSRNNTTTTTTQNNNDNNNNNNNNNKPLRIVFVGDSLTRYMYLTLTYYLKHNRNQWPPKGHTMIEKVKDPQSNNWNEWLAYTNTELQPYEEFCDCYRYWEHPFKWYRHCENRYYRDDNNDNNDNDGNFIAFITKFGGNPFHGHVLAEDVFPTKQQQQQTQQNQQTINQTLRQYDWVYPTWTDLVEQYISQWNVRPDYFVFNNGHWKAHELRSETVLKDLQRSLQRAGIVGIYRTTTFRQDETNFTKASYNANHKHDYLVCSIFPCVNVSWTIHLTSLEDDYVDPVHFRTPANIQMTQQVLDFIKKDYRN